MSVMVMSYTVSAWAIELGLPVKCRMGKECYIQNYVDHDKSESYHDYQCGHLSYNGHKGTDFRVRDYVDMRQGVDVIAAADGVVQAIRDGMVDINIEHLDPSVIQGRECGNGVIIDHGDNIVTQYCHLKNGSVVVKQGDTVQKGDVLGQVGISGMAAFPHVEMQIRKNDKAIDPFMINNDAFDEATLPVLPCEKRKKFAVHMWDEEAASVLLPYRPTALLNAWFTSSEPEAENAREGRFLEPSIARDAEMMIYWVDIMGLKLRDDLIMEIIAPNGEIIVRDHEIISRDRALYFRYLGKKAKNQFWQVGIYTGRTILLREGKRVFVHERQLTVL